MEHIILGLMLLIAIYLLIIGLRLLAVVEREGAKTLAQSQLAMDAMSKLLAKFTKD